MPKTSQIQQSPDAFLRGLVLLTFLGLCLLGLLTIKMWKKVAMLEAMPAPQASPTAPAIVSVNYTCDKKKTIDAQYMGSDKVELQLSDGRSFLLMQGMSGSGVRYVNSDESVTFWNKGNTAFLEEKNAMTFANCVEASAPN